MPWPDYRSEKPVGNRSAHEGCHSEPPRSGGEESFDCAQDRSHAIGCETRDSSAYGLRMTSHRNQCDETREDAKLSEEYVVPHLLSRRALLRSTLALGLSLGLVGRAAGAPEDLRKARPQAGDVFVFSLGDRRGQLITPQDLPLGGPPVIAYPMELTSQTIRDGSRLNQVLLVRLAQEELAEQTRSVAAEGIVGYSAVCTHTGCNISGWKGDTKHFVCPCHTSAFDPKDRARVISGPAPRPLASLPLRLVDGKIAVAGPFSGRVGGDQK
jgi:rieske iron-sulfur protein